jgi:hypothetical protein
VWQPPTSPGAGTPDGAQPPQSPYPQQWNSGASPWVQGPWSPPGTWVPQPLPAARRPRSSKVVIAIVAGCVLAVVLLGAAVVGGYAVGRAAAEGTPTSAAAAAKTSPPVAASGLGEDAGLNGYAVRCHDGDMQACDDLYDLSDPMSRYEQYGMTCAGRVKPFDVEYCTDLG